MLTNIEISRYMWLKTVMHVSWHCMCVYCKHQNIISSPNEYMWRFPKERWQFRNRNCHKILINWTIKHEQNINKTLIKWITCQFWHVVFYCWIGPNINIFCHYQNLNLIQMLEGNICTIQRRYVFVYGKACRREWNGA